MGWVLPSCPWPPPGFRVFAGIGLRCHSRKQHGNPLLGLCAPSECFQAPAAAASPLTRAPKRSRHEDRRGSSHEVCSPSAFPRTRQRTRGPGLPFPAACAFRFSQPPDASFRHVPAGLVSCRIRSWGCTLQSFAPLAWPYAVSGARPLLSFGRSRRTRLADGPTVARAPPAVAETMTRETRTRARSENRSSPGLTCPRKPPRLQGFAPRESPPLPAGGLGRRRRVALMGFPPSRALLVAAAARPSPSLPSWAFSHRTRTADEPTLQGIDCREMGASLSTPPTLMGFAAF
jgi:hypothetical protein